MMEKYNRRDPRPLYEGCGISRAEAIYLWQDCGMDWDTLTAEQQDFYIGSISEQIQNFGIDSYYALTFSGICYQTAESLSEYFDSENK